MAQHMSGKGGGALKTVNGRLDADRSIHQDRFVGFSSSAGPSNQVFRQPSQPLPSAAQTPAPFDLSNLRQHLSSSPPAQISFSRSEQRVEVRQAPDAKWAASFNAQQAGPAPYRPVNNGNSGWHNEFVTGPSQRSLSPPTAMPAPSLAPWQRPPAQAMYHPLPPPRFTTFPAIDAQQIPPPASDSREEPHQVQSPGAMAQKPLTDSQEILARTAESFVDQLSAESEILQNNPKLGNSDFLKLVRGIGNRDVVIQESQVAGDGQEVGEGARFVGRPAAKAPDWANEWMASTTTSAASSSTQTNVNGASFDVHRDFGHYTSLQRVPDFQSPYQPANQVSQSAWDKQFLDQEALVHSNQERPLAQRRKSVHFDEFEEVKPLGFGVPSSLEEALHNITSIPGAQSSWQEEIGEELDFDEETFYGFNGPMQAVRPTKWGTAASEGWQSMESDWSKYLQDNKMDERAEHYLFQAKNPYTDQIDADVRSTSPTLKGVLELEAEVQNDPSSWEAWFALGLKQQENEREDQAILALSKTIQLEPDYRPTYLALAVSYTNEGQGEAANTMLERWIDLGQEEKRDGEELGGTYEERRQRLIERLIDMARQSPEEVDADIQVALGVMCNASEEYGKAEDCFFAALSVNPDDWLLYNRLGATMANSGRSNDAIEQYHKALSLHPNFVRAHFNLGIAHSNLGQFSLAAQSILNALRLQHADATEGYAANQLRHMGSKGVTSSTLWNTLRMACQNMGRQDLATLANNRDLSGFPLSLEEPKEASI